MSKYHYKYGELLLPDIPDGIKVFPYIVIKINSGTYQVCGCNSKMWRDANKLSGDDTVLNQNAGSMSYSTYNASSDTWDAVSSGNYYTNFDEIIWVNYDIPDESESSSTIYFAKSADPIPYYIDGYLKTFARAYHGWDSTEPLSISVEANSGDTLVIGIATRSDFDTPNGFVKCFTSNPCETQTLSMVYKVVTDDGLQTISFPGTKGVLTYLTAMVFRDIAKVCYTGKNSYYFTDPGTSTFSKKIRKRKEGICTLWGITCNYALEYSQSTPYDYSATPSDMESVQSQDPSKGAVRLKMFFDDGTGEMEHTLAYPMKGAYPYAIDAVELLPKGKQYFSASGFAEIITTDIRAISAVKKSFIDWDADIPNGTALNVYSRLSNGEYTLCEKGGSISSIDNGADLSDETLYLKVELLTDDPTEPLLTPIFKGMHIRIHDQSDENVIVLRFKPGNVNSIQNAVGDITISYDGSGTLTGLGGPVLAFEKTFLPVDLNPKNSPNDEEHIEVTDIKATSNLMRIFHTNTSCTEHIEITEVSATAALTNISDI